MATKYSLPFLFLAAVPLAYHTGAIWLILPAFVLVFTLFDALLGASASALRPAGRRRAPFLSLLSSHPRKRVSRHNGVSAASATLDSRIRGNDETGNDPFASRGGIAFRLLAWAYIPLQLGLIGWGCAVASGPTSAMTLIGLALATGTTTGVFGILAAHEMIHSHRRAERGLGLAMLIAVGYGHFRISHLRGHHRHAATPADPATARRSETAYGFMLRSIAGQFIDAWRHEARRLVRANRMLRYLGMSIALYVLLGVTLGARAIAFALIVSAVAICILELFNYIAHYGLVRRQLSSGRFEPLGPQHSWNAAQRFNNWALFNGGRHSDHHRRPAMAYQALQPLSASPQLPFGYAGSIMLALLPPLWQRIMDARAERWTAVEIDPVDYSRGAAVSPTSIAS